MFFVFSETKNINMFFVSEKTKQRTYLCFLKLLGICSNIITPKQILIQNYIKIKLVIQTNLHLLYIINYAA